MKGVAQALLTIITIIFILCFSVLIFAEINLTFVSPTPTGGQNISRTHIEINITSNVTVANNASTIFVWYNQSGDNVNFTGGVTPVVVGNMSETNYTWANFTNLVNGTHRFVIYVYSNETVETTVTSINVTVDTAAPTSTINTPVNTVLPKVDKLTGSQT